MRGLRASMSERFFHDLGAGGNRRCSSSSLPASIFEKSRIWLITASSRSAELRRDRGDSASAAAIGRFQQQIEHADHAVERRAQLVAHVGQELALGAIGRLGRFFFAQQSLGLFALGNVLDGSFVVLDLAVGAAHGAAAFRNPDHAAVAAKDLRLEIRDVPLPFHDADEILAAVRVDIELAFDIADRGHQVRRRIVIVDSCQRRIAHK